VAVIQKLYGNKTSLKHMHESIVLSDRGEERTIPFKELLGFSAAWTDNYQNGIYMNTCVRFTFDMAGAFKQRSVKSVCQFCCAVASRRARQGCSDWNFCAHIISTARIDTSSFGPVGLHQLSTLASNLVMH